MITCTLLGSAAESGFGKENLAELQCWLHVTYGIFKLVGLEKSGGDYTTIIPKKDPDTGEDIPGSEDFAITYNFCAYTKLSGVKTFAYITKGTDEDKEFIPLTTEEERPLETIGLIDAYKGSNHDPDAGNDNRQNAFLHLHGIEVKHTPSDVNCTLGENELGKYSFATKIYCDEDIDQDGEAQYVDLAHPDGPCDFVLIIKHSAGCPAADFYHWGMLI